MKIHIRGDHHLDVTPALKEYAQKKLRRLERYLEHPAETEANVKLRVTRDVHSVEVTISIAHMLVRAEERSSDMYASLDLVTDKLEKQLDKYRYKLGMKMGHRQKVEGSKAKEATNLHGDAAALVAYDGEPPLVRIKEFEMKPMDVEEAIMQMDMLGHNFYVFSNSDTELPSVVYKRNDGQYGMILAR